MTMEKPGMPRRHLLRTAAVGVPAMGALSAVNLFGAPAAKAIDLMADGYWGSATTSALQEVLGTPVDGIVSSQNESWRKYNPALTSGWEWVPGEMATGSTVIAALQSRIGANSDGLLGQSTIRLLQRWVGAPMSGFFSNPRSDRRANEPSNGVYELQIRLQKGTI
jgi:prophage pi2 protein 52, muramidase